MHWSNAGHPAPVVLQVDGSTVLLDRESDLMLGVRPDITRHEHRTVLPPGSTLLLFTDGLIETRADTLEHGVDRLRAALTRHGRLAPEQLLDAVLADVGSDSREDDIAMLAICVDACSPGHGAAQNSSSSRTST